MSEINNIFYTIDEMKKMLAVTTFADDDLKQTDEYMICEKKLKQLESKTGIVYSKSPYCPPQQRKECIFDGIWTTDMKTVEMFDKTDWLAFPFVNGSYMCCSYNHCMLQSVSLTIDGYSKDITKYAYLIDNLPVIIPFQQFTKVYGICTVTKQAWKCSGGNENNIFGCGTTIYNAITSKDVDKIESLYLDFKAYQVVSEFINDVREELEILQRCGFNTAESHLVMNPKTVGFVVEEINQDQYPYPVCGIVCRKYNNKEVPLIYAGDM